MFYFAGDLHDHVAAAVANVNAPMVRPFLNRSVHHDRLTRSQVKTLGAYAREAAMRLLLDVNGLARELTEATPTTDREASGRINLGVYLFGENERPGAAPEP